MTKIILASSSARRREIFGYFNLDVVYQNPDFDEDSIPFDGDPAKYVAQLSEGKATSVTQLFPESIVIAADTIVFKDNKIYGKPSGHNDATQQLTELSGTKHSVFTGVTVAKNNTIKSDVAETAVYFNDLSPDHIEHYLNGIHALDKAGSYAVQRAGSLVIKKVDGCFYNVMGLPIRVTQNLLAQFGIDLWHCIKE